MIQKWAEAWRLDLILMQEARFKSESRFLVKGFEHSTSANIRLGKTHFGVLTASRDTIIHSNSSLTGVREALLGPRKSYLLTVHMIQNGTKLTVVNMHGINFRGSKSYEAELDSIYKLLQGLDGPMIVAGDFNCWNRHRTELIELFATGLGLFPVNFSEPDRIKSFRGYPLDAILYRGMSLVKSSVEDHAGLSDHAPMLAKFKIPNSDISSACDPFQGYSEL